MREKEGERKRGTIVGGEKESGTETSAGRTEGQIEGRSVREKEDYRRMKKTWNKGEKTE